MRRKLARASYPPRPLRRSPSCSRCVDGALQALLWQRALEPYAGAWALPGGRLAAGESLEASIRRHLAAKVDVRELAHLEQLETREPDRDPAASRPPTSGSSRPTPTPRVPAGHARGTPSTSRRRLAFDHARDRARGPRAAAREALLHERRLRARAARVHDLGAARDLPRRARPRRLGDQPAARPAAPRRARADRRAPRARAAPAAALRRSSASARTTSRSPTSSRCSGRPVSLAPCSSGRCCTRIWAARRT